MPVPLLLVQAATQSWASTADGPLALALSGPLRDWRTWLPGSALWALAVYLPLSLPLSALERRLEAGGVDSLQQQWILTLLALALALVVGVVVQLVLSWALGPSWAGSMALVVALWGLFWGLASRRDDD